MAADRRTVIENCAIATVDAQDTEHTTGHLVLAGDRIESLGPGPAPRVWRTSPAGSTPPAISRPRPGQHPPPLLPVAHPGPGHRPQPLRLARRPLPDLGAYRRGDGPRGGPGVPRDDGPRRRHHRHGPPLRLPARLRRPVRGDHRSRPRHGRPLHPRPRLHGPRRVRRRAAPDFAVETLDDALAATEETVRRHHDTSPGAMTQVAVAPAPRSPSPPNSCAKAPSWPDASACGCTPTAPRPWRRRSSATSCSAWARPTTSSPPAGSATTSGWRTAST